MRDRSNDASPARRTLLAVSACEDIDGCEGTWVAEACELIDLVMLALAALVVEAPRVLAFDDAVELLVERVSHELVERGELVVAECAVEGCEQPLGSHVDLRLIDDVEVDAVTDAMRSGFECSGFAFDAVGLHHVGDPNLHAVDFVWAGPECASFEREVRTVDDRTDGGTNRLVTLDALLERGMRPLEAGLLPSVHHYS